MNVELYTTGCPRCNVLEKKLVQANIDFKKIEQFDPADLIDRGFDMAPVLNVDNKFMSYIKAVEWINSYNQEN